MKAERVGKYRIIALLGQGGMASVYLSVVAGPLGVNKLLVVKLLREELADDADFVTMFQNEARLATRLNHANVVQTYEIGHEEGHHFLAMDYLDGQPLHAILRKASRTGVPLDIHVRILAEMLAGLHHAHTLKDFDGTPLNVVHRDVSPQNVFITYDGQVKVVDFGIAKAAGVASSTQAGVFKGKLAYVAPEQASGDPIDVRADLFSVGVMLWEAIACKRFAQVDSQTAILARRISGKEPRIRDVVPDADPELADICDQAMAHNPSDRFLSAQEFRDALEGFLQRFSRRVAAREVGLFVSGLFVEEREKIRLIIDEQMKRLHRETATEMPMPVIDAFPGAMDPTPVTTVESRAAIARAVQARRDGVIPPPPESITGTHSRGQGTLGAANISQAPPPAEGSRRMVSVGLAIFALTLGIALVVGLGFIFVIKPAATPKPAASAEVAVDAPQIKLSITFGPAGAVAKLDGASLGASPFTAQVRRDGSMHRLDIEGPGLRPDTRMVSYDKDVVVALALQAADPAPPKDEPAVASAAPADSARRPPALTGTLPKGPGKGGRGIDEKDPYKQ
ncbi:MAG: serine/threonine-protein kinase [Byssovorax sp.]